jgi:hypothetical protein
LLDMAQLFLSITACKRSASLGFGNRAHDGFVRLAA